MGQTAREFLDRQQAGDFMKLTEGDNRFRVLEKPIQGIEIWVHTEDGKKKPTRLRDNDPIIDEGNFVIDQNSRPQIKDFLAMPVYNYNLKAIQILTITQKSILSALNGYRNSKWGELTGYPVVISRTGTTLDNTEYSVVLDKADDIEEAEWKKIQQRYADMGVDMNDLYSSDAQPYGGFPLSSNKNVAKKQEQALGEDSDDINLNDIPI